MNGKVNISWYHYLITLFCCHLCRYREVSHEHLLEVTEERALQRFCQEVCDQVSGWTVGNFYDDSASEVVCPKVANSALTRHISIGYFWAHDLNRRNIIKITYCPIGDLIADFLTKPLQGSLFSHLKEMLMGHLPIPAQVTTK